MKKHIKNIKNKKNTYSTMSEKRVYTFGNGKAEGRADMRNLLGGKGANLAFVTNTLLKAKKKLLTF